MKCAAFLSVCVCLYAGVTRGEQYSSNTTLSGDEPMVTAADAPVEFNVDAGATVTVTRVISGDGKVVKSGSGTLVLAAANTFSGGLDFDLGLIRVDAEGALGTGTVTYNNSGVHCLEFHAPGATFDNDIVFNAAGSIVGDAQGQMYFTASTTLNGDIAGPPSGTVQIGPETCSGTQTDHWKVTFNGELNFPNGTLYLVPYGVMSFNGKVNAVNTLSLNRSWGGSGYIYFNHSDNNLATGSTVYCYSPYIHCGAKDALKDFAFIMRYKYNSNVANRINMHGYDQTVKFFYSDPNNATGDYVPPAAPNDVSERLSIGSDEPCTLTIKGADSDSLQTMTSHFSFIGAISVVLDATRSTYTLIMTNRTHTMSGRLMVSNGTLRATGAASFKNLRYLVVARNGKFSLETSRADALVALRGLDVDGKFTLASEAEQSFDHPDMTIGADAEITLPAGLTMMVHSLSVNGNPVADGTVLNAGDIPQLISGTIRVKADRWPDATEPIYTIETNGETNRLEDMTISVTENGATTTVPFADIANPTTGTIRKIGDGVVISTERLSGFTGQILIEEGGFAVDGPRQTGPTDSTAGDLWVKNGASLIVTESPLNAVPFHNTIHLAGYGYNGRGAIENRQVKTSASSQWLTVSLAKGVILEEDASIAGDSNSYGFVIQTPSGGATCVVRLRGHRLTFTKSPGASTTATCYIQSCTIALPGEIVMNNARVTFQTTVTWEGSLPSAFVVSNSASVNFGLYNSVHKGTKPVTLKFAPGVTSSMTVGGSADASHSVIPGSIKQGYWEGPVQIDGTAMIQCPNNLHGLALYGKVSGDGTFMFASGWLHLFSPENDFTAPLSLTDSLNGYYKSFGRGLAVYANGALPLCCRSVAVTNSPFAAFDAARFDLPAIRMHVPASTNQSMYCNAAVKGGTLAGLLKTGEGTLDYEVPFAVTGAVEVAEGTLAAAGGLEAAVLATGGGTIDGDVAVTDAFRLVPSSVANGAISELNVTGSVAFGEGAKLDLDAIADCGRIASPFQPHVVLRASGGITGTLGVEVGSETARRGWRCVIDGTTLSVFRRKGTIFCVR